MKKTSLVLLLAAFALNSVTAQIKNIENFKGRTTIPLKHGSDHPGIRTDEAMNRWRSHGLGQFIHWGVYSIPGGEWNGITFDGAAEWIRVRAEVPNEEYDNLYRQFNPTAFDAVKWARQARDMGARYVIFTTKHHDGFCMWPSRYTDYNISNSPYKKDIVKQIVDAYTAEGIDVHLYFSIMDWHQGGWLYKSPQTEEERIKWEGFKEFTRNQLHEILDSYPAISGLWFDGTWEDSWVYEAEFAHNLEKEFRAKRPDLIIGSRFRADEMGNRQYDENGDLIGDYDQTWERDIPLSLEQLNGNDWDCCMTIPENGWGYHKEWITYVKSPYELLNMMSECASLGGNFVLNFGPDEKGNIRPEESAIAAEIGEWMKANGDAIYSTAPVTDVKKQGWGFMTRKDDKLYLHIYNKPINEKVRIEFHPKTYVPGGVRLLSDGRILKVEDAGRNKKENRLFNIVLPEGPETGKPFVIELDLVDNSGDRDAFHQANI